MDSTSDLTVDGAEIEISDNVRPLALEESDLALGPFEPGDP